MKKIIKISSVLGIVSLMMFFSACEKEYYTPEEVILPNPTDTIYYSTDIQPIWDASCVKCHGGISPKLEAPSWDVLNSGGYFNASDPSSSKIYLKIVPPGSMAQYAEPGDAEILLQWLEQGALNN